MRSLLSRSAVAVIALAIPLVVPAVASAREKSNDRVASARVTVRDFEVYAPKRLPAGKVVINVKNRGPDDHELLVVRVGREDLPMRDDGLTVDEDALEDRTAGILEAGGPGSVRPLRVKLRPGVYELFCNMSGHYLGGMETHVVVKR